MKTETKKQLVDLTDLHILNKNLVAIICYCKILPDELKQDQEFMPTVFSLQQVRFTEPIKRLNSIQLSTINTAISILKNEVESKPTSRQEWNETKENE